MTNNKKKKENPRSRERNREYGVDMVGVGEWRIIWVILIQPSWAILTNMG